MKDPREGLRIIAHNSSINKTSLNDMLNMLNGTSYILPFNSKVKINELKVSIHKRYCNKSQIGKCTFSEMRMQIHLENDVYSNAYFAKQSKTKAGKCPHRKKQFDK